jgi:uracil phosphoribosyltransferase
MIHDFSKTNSIFNNFMSEIRDALIQKDSMRYRRNMERVAEIMAYELSKKLEYSSISVTTPLGEARMQTVKEQPVLATILRAGLAMHQGLLNYFDKADSAFVSAYRKHTTHEEFDVHVEYMAAPQLDNRTLIISDPMLATGKSMALVYKALIKQGKPSRVIVVSAIATPLSLEFLKSQLPDTTEYYLGAIDEELTAQYYIVPGLGDAGDLAYGEKC